MKLVLSFLFVFGLSSLMIAQEVNQVDSRGRKQGKWEKVYPGTKVYMYRGQFKDDKPVGKFTYFYKSSKVKAVIKHNEIKAGRSVAYYYHETGVLMSHGIYTNMKKDSVWLNFLPSGRISNTETYKNDELNGLKVIYFVPEDPNDKSQIISATYNYKDGMLHGEFKEFFMNGVVKKKGQYMDNKPSGAWEDFHPNGKRSLLMRYKYGVKHGWAIVYDTNMKRLAETYYYKGRVLTGDELKTKLKHMEEQGIDPNG